MATIAPRVLIIGIDGATFDLVDRWVDEGRLPNLKRLMSEGTRGRLESTVIPNSFPGWTSCTTGVNPARHGIFNALIRKDLHDYRMSVVNSHDIRYERVWQVLSREGMKVGVVNVPCSFPPVPVNGFLIGGMLSPGLDSDFTYPPGLIADVVEVTGDYVIDLQSKHLPRDQMRDELLYSVEKRGDALIHLLSTWDLDFGFFVFTETDRAQHYYWADMDPTHPAHTPERGEKFGDVIRRVYEAVDVQVGRLVDAVGEQTQIFIVSDHGFGSQPTSVYINRWLVERGFMTLNREDLTKELRDATRDVLERMGLLDAVRKGRNMLFGEPESQASLDARLGAMTFKRSNIDRIIEAVDWSRTTVYALVPRGVRINLKGREPQGIVEPDEYESVRDRAIKALKGMAYPSGELVFDRVYRREDVLDGPYLDYAPDIITCMPVGVPSCHVDTREVFAVNRGATGSHTDWGVLIARGPGIRRATEIQGARLMDVTPTALMALGVPLNSDMDGVPLLDLFDDAFRAAHPVTRREAAATGPENRIDPFSVQEEEEILEHLKGLGYIN